nr:hypothetical protein [uncultured Lachnoclostridium sp.]
MNKLEQGRLIVEDDGYFGTNKNYKNTRFYLYKSEEQKKLFDMIMQELKNNPALTGRDVMRVTNDVCNYLECQLDIVKESLII